MTQPIHPMLERVARAICQADEQNGGAPWEWYGSDKARAGYFDSARAAIQALLEPDEGMLSAAREVDSENGWSNNPENIWSAMLKPLLGDERQPTPGVYGPDQGLAPEGR